MSDSVRRGKFGVFAALHKISSVPPDSSTAQACPVGNSSDNAVIMRIEPALWSKAFKATPPCAATKV